jgi:hypothetical protein
VDDIARSELSSTIDLETAPLPNYDFTGLPSPWPDVDLLESWRWLRQYGVLPLVGGLLDQPPEWVRSMNILDAMLNVVKDNYIQEELAKRRAK